MSDCQEYLQNVDVLLIDEFGTEYNSKMKDNKSFVANNFNALVMERKRLDKTTIIASNFHAKNLKETYASEIHNIISSNFVGLEIKSATRKKTEFEGIQIKIQKPEIRDCFEDIELLPNKKKGHF
jgi:DNA replication protein DnaC